MSQTAIHVIGIDIGKNSFHIASVFGGWPAWLSIWIDLSLLLIVQTGGMPCTDAISSLALAE